jgi:hypothetical protein
MASAAHWKPMGEPPKKGWLNWSKGDEEEKSEYVVCVPPCTGKVELSKKLVSNKNVIIIELDSFIRDVNEKELLARLAAAEKEENHGLAHILYSMAASKALGFVREELAKDRKMQTIYLTSDYEWSTRSFPAHRIYVALPSRELHAKTVATTPKDQQEKMERQRTEFISRLPYEAAKTFNSFEELEEMLRSLFDVQHRV